MSWLMLWFYLRAIAKKKGTHTWANTPTCQKKVCGTNPPPPLILCTTILHTSFLAQDPKAYRYSAIQVGFHPFLAIVHALFWPLESGSPQPAGAFFWPWVAIVGTAVSWRTRSSLHSSRPFGHTSPLRIAFVTVRPPIATDRYRKYTRFCRLFNHCEKLTVPQTS